tara:strand:+ start:1337 stop:2008 length:672 start_codon:yes stop_codon:yes gene_type:complete
LYYSIIIPVFNEISNINSLLKRLKPFSIGAKNEIIIVDDGSNDGTEVVLQGTSFITLYRLEHNFGKGFAIRTGISMANYERIIIFDGDMELNPKNIYDLMKLDKKNKVKGVFGYRAKHSSYYNPTWKIGNWILTTIFNIINNSHFKDILCCAKAFYKKDINLNKLKSVGFDIDVELASALAKYSSDIESVILPYNRRSKKDGKKLRLLDGWTILKCIVRNRPI